MISIPVLPVLPVIVSGANHGASFGITFTPLLADTTPVVEPPEGSFMVASTGTVVEIAHPTGAVISLKIKLTAALTFDTTFHVYVRVNFDPINKPHRVDSKKIVDANAKDDNDYETVRLKRNQTEIPVEITAYKLYITSYDFISVDDFDRQVDNVEVTMSYPDTDNNGLIDRTWPEVSEKTVRIYLLNEQTSIWEEVSGQQTVDTAGNRVTASVGHFSVFAMIGRPMAYTDVTAVEVYPNPCKPGSRDIFDSDYIVFRKIPDGSTIKIFTVSGELVTTLKYPDADNPASNIYRWRLVNRDRENVASGVYIYMITDRENKKKTGRMSIIR
ncbi:MAG: T9SS type A sorting domain-containing protein [Elusimicrobiota bacterium]